METLIAAAILAIILSGTIFFAASMANSRVETRLRDEALSQGFSALEAAWYSPISGELSGDFLTDRSRVSTSNVTGLSVSLMRMSSTIEWEAGGESKRVILEAAPPYDASAIETLFGPRNNDNTDG